MLGALSAAATTAGQVAEQQKGQKFSIWKTLGGIGEVLTKGGIDEVEPLQSSRPQSNAGLYIFAALIVVAAAAVFIFTLKK